MKGYILGVPGKYRGDTLEARLGELGVPFERVPGSDAATWSETDLARVYSRRAAQIVSHRQLSPGEVACVLGHRSMMARLVDSADRWALLMEDDARIVAQVQPIVRALSALPDRPIVVNLASPKPLDTTGDSISFDGGRLFRQPCAQHGAVAYFMNRAAASTALNAYRRHRVDSISDWPFCWASRVQFWRPDTTVAEHMAAGAGSLLHSARSKTFRSPKRRGKPADAAIALLQLFGAGALYGRLHGVPAGLLYRRDVREARDRLRLSLSRPAQGPSRPPGGPTEANRD